MAVLRWRSLRASLRAFGLAGALALLKHVGTAPAKRLVLAPLRAALRTPGLASGPLHYSSGLDGVSAPLVGQVQVGSVVVVVVVCEGGLGDGGLGLGAWGLG